MLYKTRMSEQRFRSRGVRTIAAIEAAKGILVLVAGFGLLALVHRDAEGLAAELITHLHLNPANKVPRIFIEAASRATDAHLWLLASLAMLYAATRGIEAFGLWREREWAEWFGVATGAIYMPFELYELSRGVTSLKLGTFLTNAAVVAFLAFVLYRSRQGSQR